MITYTSHEFGRPLFVPIFLIFTIACGGGSAADDAGNTGVGLAGTWRNVTGTITSTIVFDADGSTIQSAVNTDVTVIDPELAGCTSTIETTGATWYSDDTTITVDYSRATTTSTFAGCTDPARNETSTIASPGSAGEFSWDYTLTGDTLSLTQTVAGSTTTTAYTRA